MKHIIIMIICVLGAISVVGGFSAGEPRYIQRQNSHVETGVDLPDSTPTWYGRCRDHGL